MGAGLWVPVAVPSVGVLCFRAWWEASSESPWVFGDASRLHELKRLCLFRRDKGPARNTDRPSGFAFTPRKKFLRVPRGVFSKTRPWQGVGQRPTGKGVREIKVKNGGKTQKYILIFYLKCGTMVDGEVYSALLGRKLYRPEERIENMKNDKTQTFCLKDERDKEIKSILSEVYGALKEKGYDPINQIVGYILSEDPTYITNHNNARSLICRLDRDELMNLLVRSYLNV